MNNKNLELIPCPYCGGKPKLIRCGNWKECYAYICRNCYKTPIPYGKMVSALTVGQIFRPTTRVMLSLQMNVNFVIAVYFLLNS